jgi:hypothetical protein
VKEEVVENYLYERRLIETQINHVDDVAQHVAELEDRLYKCFARIYDLLSVPKYMNRFIKLIGVKAAPFESRFREDGDYRKGLQCIRVRGLTNRAKYKKLFRESYRRLFARNEAYKKAHEDFEEETKAVNRNVKKFENNYDLLTLLNFLKDTDLEFVEKKRWLGDNFTPAEMGSIEASLSFKPIRMEQFKLDPPPNLPEPKSIQKQLNDLAGCVYGQCGERIKTLVK